MAMLEDVEVVAICEKNSFIRISARDWYPRAEVVAKLALAKVKKRDFGDFLLILKAGKNGNEMINDECYNKTTIRKLY